MDFNERNAADLLAPLLEATPAPPRVDLDEAMGTARRRRRVHRAAGGAGVIATVAVVAVVVPLGINAMRTGAARIVSPAAGASATTTLHPAAPNAEPTSLSCSEHLLPVPDGVTMALVGGNGGDPTGRYLIGRSYPHGGNHEQPLIWDNGVPHKVPIKGDDADLSAVSSNGTAVGESFSGETQSAFIYRTGKVSKLGGLTNVGPVAVNNAGTVAGARNDHNTNLPIVWRTPSSPAMYLPLPGSKWRGSPDAVLDDGTIVGTVMPTFDSMTSQTIIWHADGTFRLLPQPTVPGVTGINGFWIGDVRGNVAFGRAVVNTKAGTAFYSIAQDLNSGVVTALGDPHFGLVAGNANHWLVGMAAGVTSPVPALWTPSTGIVKLPTLAKKTGIGDEAAYISDDGKVIAGQNTDKNGVIRAVVWRCH
jgi:hypothetical protein